MTENKAIRRAARAAGVPLWRIAHVIGVSEPTLTRWLRFPLSPEREQQILAAISQIAASEEG